MFRFKYHIGGGEIGASIAQSVEHSLSKRKVGSSILP